MANCVSCGSFPCVCDDECENTDPDQGYSLSTCGQGCPPPAQAACETTCDPLNEPLASALNNFITAFFGTFTKVCVNGEVEWIEPCNLDEGVQGIPRIPGEGVACYLLRVYETLLRSCSVDLRKIWINGECYDTWQEAYDIHKNDVVPAMMLIGQGSFGDLTLTADYNTNINIVGFGPSTSILGDIHAETLTGPGYIVSLTAKDVTIGNISTKTTSVTFPEPGTTGGLIRLVIEGEVVAGNLDSSAEFGGSQAGTVVITGSGRFQGADIYTPSLDTSGNVFISVEYAVVGNITTGLATSLFAGAVNLTNFTQTSDISTPSDPATGSSSGVQLGNSCSVGNIYISGLNIGNVTIGNLCSTGDITSGVVSIGKNCTVGTIVSSDGIAIDDGSSCLNATGGNDIILEDDIESGDLTSTQSVRVGNGCVVSNINAGTFITIGNDVSQGGSFTAVQYITIGNNPKCGNLFSSGDTITVGNNGTIGSVNTGSGNYVCGNNVTMGNVDTSNPAGNGGTVTIGKIAKVTTITSTGTLDAGDVDLGMGSTCGNINASGVGLNAFGATVRIRNDCVVGNVDSEGDGSGGDLIFGTSIIAGDLSASSVNGNSGSISLDQDCYVGNLDMTAGFNPGFVYLKTGVECLAITSFGGQLTAYGCIIRGQIDKVGANSLIRDTLITTVDQDCIADLGSNDIQFQNCTFIPFGAGECINATVPRTIICFNGLGKKPLPANVSLSEGSFLDSTNLIAP